MFKITYAGCLSASVTINRTFAFSSGNGVGYGFGSWHDFNCGDREGFSDGYGNGNGRGNGSGYFFETICRSEEIIGYFKRQR